ncbi:MAG: alpha/beta hydrolase, partial [Flavobacteriaceae bacterium]|nr:alpha/beta hydrolase [Muriicola sp.]NNL39166.1 alpha/beta hydrolase [Flavobacteriaceae bacterium]
MMQKKIHVYLMPGMAANSSIFKNIKLPGDRFQIHRLEWFVPDKGMSLEAYARKMNTLIEHNDPVLIGVSFGGMLIQEMARHMPV